MQFGFRVLLTSASGVTTFVPETRIVWGLVGQGKALPSVALHLISHAPGLTLEGSDGLWFGRVQVDVYGATHASAKAVADQIIELLHGHSDGRFQLIELTAQRDLTETAAANQPVRLSLDFNTVWR